MSKVYERITVDMEDYPDLVYIELGMTPTSLHGFLTTLSLIPAIQRSAGKKPEGLLSHSIGVFLQGWQPHFIIRQYWRTFAEMERWARTGTHAKWWQEYARNTKHTSIWHEAYSVKGGVDAIYGSTNRLVPVGLSSFAPQVSAKGSVFSARNRIQAEGEETVSAPLTEHEVYT